MIFDERLRDHYTADEWACLEQLRDLTERLDPKESIEFRREFIYRLWPDQLERISKTCSILTKDRGVILLKPNYAQLKFYKEVIEARRREVLPIRGIILKARQLGFSTFIQAWQYDELLTHRHRTSMTLSYDDDSTKELFQKAHMIHARHIAPLPTVRESGSQIRFKEPHGSVFWTKTAGSESAGRSFTIHHMHCSEVPMWQNADEVFTGALQAVPTSPMSSIMIESTAKGAVGVFYEYWKDAEKGSNSYIPFFAPWYWDPEYTLPFASKDHAMRFARSMSKEEGKYREKYRLTLEQMHWRKRKIQDNLQGSEKLFRQEYPACADEAFLTTGSPVFNPEKIQDLYEHADNPAWTGEVLLAR